MHIHRVSHGLRGFARLTNYALRWAYMVTEAARRRARILAFFHNHGPEATAEAFGMSLRTLARWQQNLRRGNGQLEALNPQSRKPHRCRRRSWPDAITAELRRLRTEHPNLGPDKVALLLVPFAAQRGLPCPKARTVARIIAAAPGKMRVFPVKVRHNGRIVPRQRAVRLRKPKRFVATYPGHCGAFDTVERFIHGCRRYVITFTDVYSRFSLAWATTSHASAAAAEFLALVQQLFPFPLTYVLTDNGSEFLRHFEAELRRLHRVHWHTYPKTPKMNAHEERFNRTIQEEFIDYHEGALLAPHRFNAQLLHYLLWFNGERPHWSLGLKSPIQFLTEQNPSVCHMWWRDTTR